MVTYTTHNTSYVWLTMTTTFIQNTTNIWHMMVKATDAYNPASV